MPVRTVEPAKPGLSGWLGEVVVRWRWVFVAVWVMAAVALPTSMPSLAEQARDHPISLLPDTAPSVVAGVEMSRAFRESALENYLVVVLTDERGLNPGDEAAYRQLIDALQQHHDDVGTVQNFISTPALRGVLTSADRTSWLVPIGLAGAGGDPQAAASYNRIAAIVKRSLVGSTLEAHLTGPVATDADLDNIGARDLQLVELAAAVVVIAILLITYRNPVTMMLLVTTTVACVAVSRGAVSALCNLGLDIGGQTALLMTGVVVALGVSVGMVFVNRYHQLRRAGVTPDDVIRRILVPSGRMPIACAASVAIAFSAMSFTGLDVFSSVGAALAVGVAVTALGAATLLPALLVIVGRRGFVDPRRVTVSGCWRHWARGLVRKPARHLAVSAALLGLLAAAVGLSAFNYDVRQTLPATAPSSVGYAALDRHFRISSVAPVYLVVHATDDLRTPQALADLEQMARRVSQLPDIATVSGVTRPAGVPLAAATVTDQAGGVGEQIGTIADVIGADGGELNRLSSGAAAIADDLDEARGEVSVGIGKVRDVLARLAALQRDLGGGKSLAELDNADALLAEMRSLGDKIAANVHALNNHTDWVDPVLAALDGNPVCDADPNCVAGRDELQHLSEGAFDDVAELGRELSNTQAVQSLSATTSALRRGMDTATKAMRSMGLDSPASVQDRLSALQRGADRLASGSRQVADGVQQLVSQINGLGGGLVEASNYLMTMQRESTTPAMAGFYLPPEAFTIEQFKQAAEFYISPDGRTARYLVRTTLDPFGVDSMDQVGTIARTARSAQPNTTLATAHVSLVGLPVTLRDIRDYDDHDLRYLVVVTIAVMFGVFAVALRAIVAPLYLVAFVSLSALAALGIAVVVFQFLLGTRLAWSVSGLTFVVLVAVGTAHSMLLVSRVRDASTRGTRIGVIRALGPTGDGTTAAGLTLAATLLCLAFGSLTTSMQTGFVLAAGFVLNTLIVRAITVPVIAALLGAANWWPSRWPSTHRNVARRWSFPAGRQQGT
ncbi:MMPL family transporter [Mycolicibacterium sp. CBM1]